MIIKGKEIEGVKEKWNHFKETMSITRKICGVKTIYGKRKKNSSEWWSKELEVLQDIVF